MKGAINNMTRKHFIAIAQAIRTTSNKNQLVDELCIIFKRDNSLFSKDKFINACKK